MAHLTALPPWPPDPPGAMRSVYEHAPLGDDGSIATSGGGFGDMLPALRRRALLVAAIAATIIIVAAYFVLTEQPVYTATAVLRLGDARRALTSGIETPDMPVERLTSPLLSQLQLVRSRALIGSVVDSVGLRLVPRFEDFRPTLLRDVRVEVSAVPDTIRLRFGPIGLVASGRAGRVVARYGEPVHIGGVSFVVASQPRAESAVWAVVSRERAVDLVLRNLRVKPRTQTNVVDVSYTAHRRLVAQRVANEIATQFQASSARSAQEQSRRRRLFLEQQLRQTDAALTGAQLALSEFRRQAQIFNSSERVTSMQRGVARADERLEELEAQRAMYATLLSELRAAGGGDQDRLRSVAGSPAIRDNPAIVQLYTQYARHRSALDSLTTGHWRRPDTDPDVQRLRELIASAEGQLVSTIGAQIAWLTTQAASVEAVRRRTASALGSMSGVEVDEVQLRQDVEARRAVSDRLRDDLQRARMAEAVELGPVEVVDLAGLPFAPANSFPALKLLLASLFGLGLGVAVAFLLEKRDTSIRDLAGVERWLQRPGLALIPSIAPPEAASALKSFPTLARRPQPNGGGASAEAYRVLRTNLAFARAGAPRSLVVTSPTQSDGKTITAANLGVAFARGGASVLLVDCDLWRPALHRLFKVSANPGLVHVLRGAVQPTEAIRPTTTDGLFVLPAGTGELASWEPLRGDRTLELLDSLITQFDIVILDAPPALAVADTSILAALSQGVLVVVRAGRTSRTDAQRTIGQLEMVGARVVGVVLNDVRPQDLSSATAYYAPSARASMVT
jgi:succinoglycan biosynthesis transport protein ExoP